MTETGYATLKTHFDRLLTGGYPESNGLEQIRDVYESAFGSKIHRYDVYQTRLRVRGNPIDKVLTLIGPSNDDLKSGIIPCINDITCVNIIDSEYLKGITKDNIDSYVNDVYSAMSDIIEADSLYTESNRVARNHPYRAFLILCPIYFTFHHIKHCVPDMVEHCTVFKSLMEKYAYTSEEDIDKVLLYMNNTKYSTDFEDIYATMTFGNTVELF